jgi:hypothetical protein
MKGAEPLYAEALRQAVESNLLGPASQTTRDVAESLASCLEHLNRADEASAIVAKLHLDAATVPSTKEAGPKALNDVAFWFDYNFEPKPGPRRWKLLDASHWKEVYPDGHVDEFTVIGRSSDLANPGTVLRREPDTGFEVLISVPIKEGAPIKFRDTPHGAWKFLASMHTPASTSPATNRGPSSQPSRPQSRG